MKKTLAVAILTTMAAIPAARAQTHYGVTQGWCAQNGGHFRATGRVGTDIGECTILPQSGGGGGGGGGSAPGISNGQRAAAMFGLAAGIIGLLGQAIDQSNQIDDREYRDRQAYDIEQGLASQKQALERALAAAQHAEAHQRAGAMEALAARMKLAEREADRSLAVIREKIAANARQTQSANARRPNPFARPSATGASPERRSGISGPSNNRGSSPGTGGACNALGGCPDASNRDDRPRQRTAQGEGALGGAVRRAEPVSRGSQNPPATQPVQAPAQVPAPTSGGMASVVADVLTAVNTPANTGGTPQQRTAPPGFKYVDTCGADPVPVDVVACWHNPYKIRVAANAIPNRKISRKELLRRLIAEKRQRQAGNADAATTGATMPVEIEIEAPVEEAGNEEAKLYGYWDHTVTESTCRSMNGSWRVPPVRTLPSCQLLSDQPRADSGEEFGLAGSETDFSVRETVREVREATGQTPLPADDGRTLFERANEANRRALEDGRVRGRD